MIQVQLLRILAYIWIAFGAYWMGFNLLGTGSPKEASHGTRRLRVAFLAITLVLLFLGRGAIPPVLLIIFGLSWGGLGLYWATPGNSASSGEFRLYRPLRLLVLAGSFALLLWDRTAVGVLGQRFVPLALSIAVAGFVAVLLGMALALWARTHLGPYWSDKVVLKLDHQLIRTGPYAYLRHPIYSGVLLGVAGTAWVVGEWRGVLAFLILLTNYAIKAKREERILAGAFADSFADHKRRAGFLLPRLRPRG